MVLPVASVAHEAVLPSVVKYLPELATRGLLLMNQFYNLDGTKKHNQDLELPYPDLSKFDVFKQ